MIEINNITKTFDDYTAIKNLSFTVNESSLYGLVGYNGAGKTTLLKIIAPTAATFCSTAKVFLSIRSLKQTFSMFPTICISVSALR